MLSRTALIGISRKVTPRVGRGERSAALRSQLASERPRTWYTPANICPKLMKAMRFSHCELTTPFWVKSCRRLRCHSSDTHLGVANFIAFAIFGGIFRCCDGFCGENV